ncbi:hypothetical protein MKUB_05750 [Mycobacterium kubicae]|uniref:Uncharacterized protein n=1 Tax=Mycobacterium kubicae TaxID=120959 RepID=A0AAX1JCG0_9MYCO|nr:hypothetical protein [Mycobacterium kubicae]MCV7096752.1 hypothetical protein [Mycobacterium kubicae]OBF15832.1 hypothetical protein A5725_02905 [Mycobacterium kubicae]ORW01573.1 hypothetical protein AWC13_07265 [Mycobacterium kubicae]QNI10820.1 hypothetical protein GAN18_05960 [Mycobacterium kubicae]QPI39028.1 hypothetical protein I2456_05860 [Mycobacterium kubicae]
MTAAFASDARQENRTEQLKLLRQQMAAVSEKMSARTSAAPVTPAQDLLPESPPVGPVQLPRGSVAVLAGAKSLVLQMVAAVTADGGHAAIVGQPAIGLLAAAEMGADLSRIAVIPDPGTDPVEVAAVLIDGMDLVVLGLGGRRVTHTRARAVVARARHKGCTLLVTDGDWEGAPTRLEARVCGYEITAGNRGAPTPGFGRISGVRLQISGCAGGRTLGRVRTG